MEHLPKTSSVASDECSSNNMATKEETEDRVVLTPPISLEGGLATHYRGPKILHSIVTLFQNVRPGSDLTKFQLPPMFNMPKSQLQLYGESLYCIGEDMLSRCVRGKSSLERFTCVVAWAISTTRPPIFGLAPFNPILGETHHVSRGTLNVMLEQVSHHPPVTALHATNEKENVELIWCQNPIARFYGPGTDVAVGGGESDPNFVPEEESEVPPEEFFPAKDLFYLLTVGTSVNVVVQGKRQVKLLNFGENYEMNTPNLLIRFFPMPMTNWVGNVLICCEDSGLKAELCYRGQSFLGFGRNCRSIKGKIFNSSSRKTIYEIDGHWDGIVSLKDPDSRKCTILYNAKDVISKLKTPTVRDSQGLLASESALVWSEVSQSILNKEWGKAIHAKRSIEEKARRLERERINRGDNWVPKHFNVPLLIDGRWECIPKYQSVPIAPIIVVP